MSQSLFSRGPLQRINLKQPAHEVKEVRIFALETLLQSGLLGNQNVDPSVLLFRLRLLPLSRLLAFGFLVVLAFLVDQSFAREEILN